MILLGITAWFWIAYIVATIILAFLTDKDKLGSIIIKCEAVWVGIAIISALVGAPLKMSSFLSIAVVVAFIGSLIFNGTAIWKLGKSMTEGSGYERIETVDGELMTEEDDDGLPTSPTRPRLGRGGR